MAVAGGSMADWRHEPLPDLYAAIESLPRIESQQRLAYYQDMLMARPGVSPRAVSRHQRHLAGRARPARARKLTPQDIVDGFAGKGVIKLRKLDDA